MVEGKSERKEAFNRVFPALPNVLVDVRGGKSQSWADSGPTQWEQERERLSSGSSFLTASTQFT